MQTILELNNISKSYPVIDSTSGLRKKFWALKDISFSLSSGICAALTGVNGSGKSTLFRIISQIITPSAGSFLTRGSVVPLLDLGAGFHDELSGRENAFVYASLLGIHRSELKERFDEIIEFAGIGVFLDSKLRSYSSGMKVRLAFSIASSFKPDLLLADEILAVGDESFQERCLNRILELKQKGTSILMTQHDRKLLRHVCDEELLLDGGRLISHTKTFDDN